MAGFLEGKVVAVTGGGGGIGRAVALAVGGRGGQGAGGRLRRSAWPGEDPSSEVADAVVAEIGRDGGEAIAVADDISKMESGERLARHGGRDAGAGSTASSPWPASCASACCSTCPRTSGTPSSPPTSRGTSRCSGPPRRSCASRRAAARWSGFTSGAFAGSVAQANYSAAKGGIVSLVRSAAVGLYRYGVTANAIAPVARTRMSANVPTELAEMGDPEDVAPMVVYLLSDQAKHVTGQVYTVVGSKIAVWNQPAEVRAMWADGRWTPEQIAARLDGTVGQERMGMIDRLEQMRQAAASGEKPNA